MPMALSGVQVLVDGSPVPMSSVSSGRVQVVEEVWLCREGNPVLSQVLCDQANCSEREQACPDSRKGDDDLRLSHRAGRLVGCERHRGDSACDAERHADSNRSAALQRHDEHLQRRTGAVAACQYEIEILASNGAMGM